VADGMGGHQAGEIASRKAVSFFVSEVEKNLEGKNKDDTGEELKQILLKVNETLIEEGRKVLRRNGMGTTLSALYIKNSRGYIVHVGDSRIYRYSNSKPGSGTLVETASPAKQLNQLTEDHSFVGKLLKDGFITEEEARHHPKRNVIYQSIGMKREIDIQVVKSFPIKQGEKYLLCSDGLYNVVSNSEIIKHLKGVGTAGAAKQLIKEAKACGGPDNISVIVVSTEQDKDENKTALDLTDTVKIVSPLRFLKVRKRKKIVFFILLGLMLLLLMALIYMLVMAVDTGGETLSAVESGYGTIGETLGEWVEVNT